MVISSASRIMLLSAALAFMGGVASANDDEAPPAAVDFDRIIRPILADKCFNCHGPDEAAREAGLRLDVRDEAVAAGAIVPGSSDESELVQRIISTDPDLVMPPADANLTLSERQRQQLISWIESGADYRQHWSLEPVPRPSLPAVRRPDWARNPIDYFVLARLEQQGLEAAPPADPYRLVRRLYLDLLGLPPTPEIADSFAEDDSADAYQRLVESLLASPAFGERMAWDWLNAARYADSNGYQGDRERTMWPWRDWVVDGLNRNLAYDQFTVWQLAGDLLPGATREQQLATGFCRNHMINGEGGRIPEENRVDYVMDMTETMGTIWLGLTLNCCRCHDHKYDPLTRRDYYSLYAFFNQTPVDGGGGDPQSAPNLPVPSDAQQRELERLKRAITIAVEQVLQAEASLLDAATASQDGAATEQQRPPEKIRTILAKAVDQRNGDELSELETHWAESRPDYAERVGALRETRQQRDNVRKAMPRVMVMADRAEARATFMLDKGLYNKPQDEVTAAVPGSLPALAAGQPSNRLGLARWLVADENPLTARVTVNRIWRQFFGRGLVKTAEDFGTQGERPSHPELLDWLADDFQRSGWDVKRLCRLVVTSATYQQSSRTTSALRQRDPENRWLARGPRHRLPSWMIRDQALAVSGLLVNDVGGAPVNPYQPAGVWEDATFGKKQYQQDHGRKLYRRSLYTFWRRIVAPPLFFDSASRQTCTVKQSRTNTPLHALTTLNDVTYVEAARVLADRILADLPDGTSELYVEAAFRRVLVRRPAAEESRLLVASLDRLRQQFAGDLTAAERFIAVGEYPLANPSANGELAALTGLCNALMNLDETLSKE